jgi:hypothetical protein
VQHDPLSLADRMSGSIQGLRGFLGDALAHHGPGTTIGRLTNGTFGRNAALAGRSVGRQVPFVTTQSSSRALTPVTAGAGAGSAGAGAGAGGGTGASGPQPVHGALHVPGARHDHAGHKHVHMAQEEGDTVGLELHTQSGRGAAASAHANASHAQEAAGGGNMYRTASFRPQSSPSASQALPRLDASRSTPGGGNDGRYSGADGVGSSGAGAAGLVPNSSVGRIVGSLVDAHGREATAAAAR